MAEARPNILCFVTDQQRADHLGCYGNAQIRTPNIDRLAQEGVVFTQSYVANPVCMPNRASMLTGRYPKAHGLRENGNTLSPSEIVLPEMLRRAGYQTCSIGKIHLAPFGARRENAKHEWDLYESKEYWDEHSDLPLPFYGLDEVCLVDGHGPYAYGHYKWWLDKNHPGSHHKLSHEAPVSPPTGARQCWKASIPEELHYNAFIGDRTIDWLRRRNQSRPFFLWCSFPDPHHPFSPPQPWCDLYDPADIDFRPARRDGELNNLPDYFRRSYEGAIGTGGLAGDLRGVTDDHYREIVALTYGMISMVDDQIGRILEELERQSLIDNTVIVFFSDHGDLMGDHWLINKGPYLYDGLVRIPTIWRIPDVVGRARLLPSRGTPPNGSAGASPSLPSLISTADLCPTLLDLADLPAPDGIQGRSYKGILTGEASAVRDWVYIEYDESYIADRLRQIRSADWSLTAHACRPDGLLFDLRSDPRELTNLWDDPACREIKQELIHELFRQTSQADDWLPPKICHA